MKHQEKGTPRPASATKSPGSLRDPHSALQRLSQIPGVPAPPGYSHAVIAAHPVLVAVAGQLSVDASGTFIGTGDFATQVEQAFRNLVAVLAAAGCTPADVVKLTHFVVGLEGSRLATVRAVRDRFFHDARPASSLLGVASLASPQALYEVEALAAREA